MKYFEKSKTVRVSRITADGWWSGNTMEHVVKGTALSNDFTENVYSPSRQGMIAKYDRNLDQWSDEIEDMTCKPYWDSNGREFIVATPDGKYPEWAILIAPLEYNKETHTVSYDQDMGWKVHEICIGKVYYDEFGIEFVVSDYNFILPEKHTWESPPKPKLGYAFQLINGVWVELVDYRNKTAYAKDRDNPNISDYVINDLGDIPETHTFEEYGVYDTWLEGEWQYDIERHRPIKFREEKSWRNNELAKVIDRIDQYEKDQNYPEALRTSPIRSHDDFLLLLNDRKMLSDYPSTIDFPFGERPVLSEMIQDLN